MRVVFHLSELALQAAFFFLPFSLLFLHELVLFPCFYWLAAVIALSAARNGENS